MTGHFDPEELLRELQEGESTSEFYALLNISKDANQEEIRRSYHRLCRIYHPDRYQDERKQKTATEFFRRIQEAYKVLSDPRTRAIYDKRGMAGLSEDMAIVERTTLPSELMEEYEKLRELWEERSFIQKCHPSGDFEMEMDATSFIDGGNHSVSVEKYSVEQSVEARITKSACGEVTGMVTSPNPKQIYGLIRFSLAQFHSEQNWYKGSLFLGNNPGVGVDFYHVLGDEMYLTGRSSIYWIGGGYLRFGGTVSIHRRLNSVTTGTLTVHDMGSATSVKVTQRVSATTSVSGDISIGVSSSHIGANVEYTPIPNYLLKAGAIAGTNGLSLVYGIEHNVDKVTTIGSSVLVGPTGVVLGLKLERASMNFGIKLRLSDFVGLNALFFATSLPLVIYGCVRSLAIVPLLRKEWIKEIREKRQERAKEVLEKKRTAEAAVELMQETLERVVNTEQAKHGLLIVEAWYGKLFDHHTEDILSEPKVIDVRIPLQCMVADSKLILRETSKANIPGFYDPCVGERKYLRTKYEFRGMPHEVTVENCEPLVIPRMSHRVLNHTEL